MNHEDLIGRSAVFLLALLRSGELTPFDLLDALEARIAAVDAKVNALPILCFDRARRQAAAMMAAPQSERGLLAGLPVPIKDLTAVAGVRTTFGSSIYAQHVPQQSDLLVDRLERQGGIVYAKSNTPEFGAGANTFNDVFGATLNPYDIARSAAGSSGGAAVALATGMAWLAHGSDMGGSLRNPASFCSVVGLRPTPGRVAQSRPTKVDSTLSVQGPMARCVEDLALLLDAMSGEDSGDPLSKPAPAKSFLSAVHGGFRPPRVAYSPDLGITPVDPQVVKITRAAAERLAAAGLVVEEAHPDFSGAHESFQTLRALSFAVSYASLLRDHRDRLKPEIVWNIEKGLALSAADIVRAEHQRAAIMNRTNAFFHSFDVLICPATIVTPFPIGERYLAQCDGVHFATYIDWLAIAYAPSLAGTPALSLPCGFDQASLPVGLQMIAAPNNEAKLLAAARLAEEVFGLNTLAPIDPRPPVSA